MMLKQTIMTFLFKVASHIGTYNHLAKVAATLPMIQAPIS